MYSKKKKKILISSRPEQKKYSGFFEFPGGKVKKTEFLLTALKRELIEELSISIDLNKTIFLKNYRVKRGNFFFLLNFFVCDKWYGNIKPMEGQVFKWTTIDKLKNENMLKSNRKIIEYLNCNFNFSKSLMKLFHN